MPLQGLAFGRSWQIRVVPPLVGLVAGGIFLVATIVSKRRGKKEPKGDDEARTN